MGGKAARSGTTFLRSALPGIKHFFKFGPASSLLLSLLPTSGTEDRLGKPKCQIARSKERAGE